MMNNYLEKIAFLGFSKKEKLDKAYARLYIDTHNSYANAFNSNAEHINSSYTNLDAKGNVYDYKDYAKHILKHMKANKELVETHSSLHAGHVAKLKNLGVDYKRTSKEDLDSFLEDMTRQYSNVS